MLKYNEPLSRHTSFRIGGPAYLWAEPGNPKEILEIVSLAEGKNKKVIIAGNGTNLLARDEGFDGVIIHLAGDFEKIESEGGGVIKAGSSFSLARLVKYALDKSLAGCEFLTGIPGDIGGAVFMNAGVRRPEGEPGFIEIKEMLVDIEVLDLKDKTIKDLDKKDIDFKYRSSGLDGKIILGARLGLKKDKSEDIELRMAGFNKKREWLAKIGFPNAGSIFKNPSVEKPAGMLIESCGLKGRRIGDAEISGVHANVIVNLGKATAKDVLGLIDLGRTSVKQKFGIELELELKVI
ncbi:MAG: UDP-N-acetylenolpyruvoylglucosamine reductase [Candidatus Omnitrophica bacterium CG_4_9_14_0_2_um_filter_42_8]|nr:MAG: UDP-N-acetylenolpyruvoylglucosamine reductase [Candidatus Omnitrophica bacterium CG22_combo_CG10-13_8_21_14_all_43_16]PJC48514.1 MAG: UDP-N-acetylenolpyruvoylglucosamine reductase [Candidatus Omnitrophica bacterium CG_4_9_14_0_2_um_filter_42_8]